MKKLLQSMFVLSVGAACFACASGGEPPSVPRDDPAPASASPPPVYAAADPCWCANARSGVGGACAAVGSGEACAAREGCTWLCE